MSNESTITGSSRFPAAQPGPYCVTGVTFGDLVITPTPVFGGPSEYLDSGNWPEVDVDAHPDGDSVLFGGIVASNWNVPPDLYWVAGSGWTTLGTSTWIRPDNGHPLWALICKVGGAGGHSPTGTYTPGYESQTDSVWAAAGFAVRGGEIRQSKYAEFPQTQYYMYLTFDATPLPGNAIALVAFVSDFYRFAFGGVLPTPHPNDGKWVFKGWTAAWKPLEFTSCDAVMVWVRCVDDGDGDTYGLNPSASGIDHGIVIAEVGTASQWGDAGRPFLRGHAIAATPM